jgi:dipeptidyl-peptidase-4
MAAAIAAGQPTEKLQSSLQRIFNSNEFSGGGRGGGGRRGGGAGTRWIEGGRAYAAIEAGEIVRYDTATGKREVWVSAAQLAQKQPTDFAWSADGKKLLIATNPNRVLIRKNAAEYWVMDKANGSWRKLGGEQGADLLFAKLSPDGTRAAYVQGTNLYVEELATGAVKALTSDGTDLILNGVSDWVYDEEFSLADGFRWSPDGQRIAYWQFDQHGVPEYTLVNYTDGLYPTLFKYPYPKAGQTNSAVRVGVVSANGGGTTWMKAPGDPRNIYIPRMEWAGSGEVIFEQLNRLQNTLDVQIANAGTGEVHRMFRDQDAAWVEVNSQIRWLEGGKRLLWTSERDGWRHAYSVGRDGDMRLITRDAGDVISIASVDEAGGWLYYIASPEEPTRRYLYRTRLDGSARAAGYACQFVGRARL